MLENPARTSRTCAKRAVPTSLLDLNSVGSTAVANDPFAFGVVRDFVRRIVSSRLFPETVADWDN